MSSYYSRIGEKLPLGAGNTAGDKARYRPEKNRFFLARFPLFKRSKSAVFPSFWALNPTKSQSGGGFFGNATHMQPESGSNRPISVLERQRGGGVSRPPCHLIIHPARRYFLALKGAPFCISLLFPPWSADSPAFVLYSTSAGP